MYTVYICTYVMFASEWTQPTGKMITMWSVLGQTSSANSYYMNTEYCICTTGANTVQKIIFKTKSETLHKNCA